MRGEVRLKSIDVGPKSRTRGFWCRENGNKTNRDTQQRVYRAKRYAVKYSNAQTAQTLEQRIPHEI